MNSKFAAEILFAASVMALLYTYAGYPLLVWMVSRLRPRPVKRAPGEPRVSVIITAYNEELDLGAKLENTLDLSYPPELLEVIVASDCSTDRTDEIARTFSHRGVKLVRQSSRAGKTAAQNAAVREATGEIIVFSDATSKYDASVLRAIVPNFADASVGCVAGRLVICLMSKLPLRICRHPIRGRTLVGKGLRGSHRQRQRRPSVLKRPRFIPLSSRHIIRADPHIWRSRRCTRRRNRGPNWDGCSRLSASACLAQ